MYLGGRKHRAPLGAQIIDAVDINGGKGIYSEYAIE
jgi:hypothetical protein